MVEELLETLSHAVVLNQLFVDHLVAKLVDFTRDDILECYHFLGLLLHLHLSCCVVRLQFFLDALPVVHRHEAFFQFLPQSDDAALVGLERQVLVELADAHPHVFVVESVFVHELGELLHLRDDFFPQDLNVLVLRELGHVVFELFHIRFGGGQSKLVLELGFHLLDLLGRPLLGVFGIFFVHLESALDGFECISKVIALLVHFLAGLTRGNLEARKSLLQVAQ